MYWWMYLHKVRVKVKISFCFNRFLFRIHKIFDKIWDMASCCSMTSSLYFSSHCFHDWQLTMLHVLEVFRCAKSVQISPLPHSLFWMQAPWNNTEGLNGMTKLCIPACWECQMTLWFTNWNQYILLFSILGSYFVKYHPEIELISFQFSVQLFGRRNTRD